MIRKRYINFKAKNEDWNEYKLEDGSIFRARHILIKIIDEGKYDEHGNPMYALNSTNIVGIFVPDELRGPPSNETYTPEELKNSIVKEDMKFESIREVWNTYELENGAEINFKLVLVAVSRTNKFDPMGEPIYRFNIQGVSKGKVPEQLKKKPSK